MEYVDIFGYKHSDCSIISSDNEYKRVFIIEDSSHRHFVCLKPDATPKKGMSNHWELSKDDHIPDNYWDPFD